MEYDEFLQSKKIRTLQVGIDIDKSQIHEKLFLFQRDITHWAIRKGRAAIFLDTGLGKTFCQLEWARLIAKKTLIVAPLSVARQTVKMAKQINLDVKYIRHSDEMNGEGIYITNYDIISNIDPLSFDAVVLDESSILKAISGKTRKKITEMFSDTKYRLCCTATPAPNDLTEIGNHAEFLGICTEPEMKSMFFINANAEHTIVVDRKIYRKKGSNKGGQEWRLKHPAESAFFEWLSSWAFSLTKPSDIGYDDDGFILPKLNINPHYINIDYKPDDSLFFMGLKGISDRMSIRRKTINYKLAELKKIIASDDGQWIIWCGLNNESDLILKELAGNGAMDVSGDEDPDIKAEKFENFQDGKSRILITKPKIGGFGMNFQNANNMIFFGLNDSWETWYQAIRRQYRFGQTKPVNVYVILTNIEEEIYRNVLRKDAMAKRLRIGLIDQIKKYEIGELAMKQIEEIKYDTKTIKGKYFTAMLGDSCERLQEIETNSIDLSVYSPPFADLFTYSDSPRDLGNSKNWDEFFNHYQFIIKEVLRVTKLGRLTCVHTSDIPAMAARDGWIGMKDFPGAVIQEYEKHGWTFVGRAFVQKNPQAQAIRVKSKALLFVQLRKDSSDSRPAIIDQVLFFKKDGENAVPVRPVDNKEIDNEKWIEWANGIWIGIRETDTLQYSVARDPNDEKHICPLQLGTIERCIKLYSNPGETVLSPFMGIGSEVYQAVKFGRNGIGIELKQNYFDVAVRNLRKVEDEVKSSTLFDMDLVEQVA